MSNFFGKERFAVGGFLVAAGQVLVFDFQGAAGRLQEIGQLLWALAPVIGVGLTVFGGVLLAGDLYRAFVWLRARTPANRFGADEHQFKGLYERWRTFEERNKREKYPTENRLLLIEDTNVLFKKHGIPPPKGTDPDVLWKTVMLVSLVASKARDLKRARKQMDWVREKVLPPADTPNS